MKFLRLLFGVCCLWAATVSAQAQTSTYRFVGVNCSASGIGGFTQIGQSVQLTDAQAAMLLAARCALVPDATFSTLGFTTNELAVWGNNTISAPGSFLTKLYNGQAAWLTSYHTLFGTLGLSGSSSMACRD